MIATNSSDLSLNNNNINNKLSQVMCRQSKYSKRRSSHPKSCSTTGTLTETSLTALTATSSSLDRQTIRRKGNQRRGKYVSNSCQISSIVKNKLLKVKNSAKNVNIWTHSLSNRVSKGVTHCFKSINSWTKYKPISYLIQLIGRCCQPWIKSKKSFRGDDKLISRLPHEVITRKNSPNQQNYQKINKNNDNNNNNNSNNSNNKSSNYSSLYLNSIFNMYSPLLSLVLLISFICRIAEACSSRSTPKPRPPSPTTRPNITFQTYACPEAYAKWYCLNGATCFSVRIGESILYNCECADGYMGQRCEFKDLDGSYLPSREKVLVETASIAGGVTLAVLLMCIIIIFYYTYLRHRKKEKRISNNWEIEMDQVNRKPFSRVNSLRRSSPRNMSYTYGDDCFGPQEDKRLQPDLECGDDSVPYTFRPVIIASENCDQNHDK